MSGNCYWFISLTDKEWTWYQSLWKISQKGHFKMKSKIWHNYVLIGNLKKVDQLEINGQYSEKEAPLDTKTKNSSWGEKEIVNEVSVFL